MLRAQDCRVPACATMVSVYETQTHEITQRSRFAKIFFERFFKVCLSVARLLAADSSCLMFTHAADATRTDAATLRPHLGFLERKHA